MTSERETVLARLAPLTAAASAAPIPTIQNESTR